MTRKDFYRINSLGKSIYIWLGGELVKLSRTQFFNFETSLSFTVDGSNLPYKLEGDKVIY